MDIRDSVEFLLGRKQATIESFYDRFLKEHPEARPYFTGVDLREQASMLTMALVVVEAYYTGDYPATERYLQVLGYRHCLANIPRALYPGFRDCLVETLAEMHEAEWDDDLQNHWHAAIDKTVAAMLKGYDQPRIF